MTPLSIILTVAHVAQKHRQATLKFADSWASSGPDDSEPGVSSTVLRKPRPSNQTQDMPAAPRLSSKKTVALSMDLDNAGCNSTKASFVSGKLRAKR